MYEICFWYTLYIACVRYRERIVDNIKKGFISPGFRQDGVVSVPEVGSRVLHVLPPPRAAVWMGIWSMIKKDRKKMVEVRL